MAINAIPGPILCSIKAIIAKIKPTGAAPEGIKDRKKVMMKTIKKSVLIQMSAPIEIRVACKMPVTTLEKNTSLQAEDNIIINLSRLFFVK